MKKGVDTFCTTCTDKLRLSKASKRSVHAGIEVSTPFSFCMQVRLL